MGVNFGWYCEGTCVPQPLGPKYCTRAAYRSFRCLVRTVYTMIFRRSTQCAILLPAAVLKCSDFRHRLTCAASRCAHTSGQLRLSNFRAERSNARACAVLVLVSRVVCVRGSGLDSHQFARGDEQQQPDVEFACNS